MTLLDLATHTSGLPRVVDIASSNGSATSQRWRWLRDHATASPGSAAVYSNMALWIKAQLGFGAKPDKAGLAMSQAVYVHRQALPSVEGMDAGGHADGIGLGWVFQSASKGRPELLEKTGGGNGFMTYMVLVPSRSVGIFVAVSRVDVPMLSAMAASVNELAGQVAKGASR